MGIYGSLVDILFQHNVLVLIGTGFMQGVEVVACLISCHSGL
jgi:hypothetical protein